MKRNVHFRKKEILELIEILKTNKIYEVNFQELSKNIHQYIPDLEKPYSQIFRSLKKHKNFFADFGISVLDTEGNPEIVEENIAKEALLYFKNILKKDIITVAELKDILQDKYNLKFFNTSYYFKKFNLNNIMNNLSMSFLTKEKKKERVQKILKNFASTEIVKILNLENKTIALTEIYKILKHKVSISTLYNYSKEMLEMGIPVKTNKTILNSTYDEKDTINKIASDLKRNGVNQIYAGHFAKRTYPLSLPRRIGYKDVLKYKKYIEDIHGIIIMSRDEKKKEDLTNGLQDNIVYLSKNKFSAISYVKELPEYNRDNLNILALENINNNLENLWTDYLKKYIFSLMKDRKNVYSELVNQDQLKINTENKKTFFLVHDKLHIKNLTISDIFSLSRKNINLNDKLYGIHRQNMFFGFIIFLYTKKQILLSFQYIYYDMYAYKNAQKELILFENEFFIHKNYINALDRKFLNTKDISIKRLVYFFTCTININCTTEHITNEMFLNFDKADRKNSLAARRLFYKFGANLETPTKANQFTEKYYLYMKNKNYQNLLIICNKYINKKIKLKQTSTPKKYRKEISGLVANFLSFVDTFHPGMMLTNENLKKLFNFPESTCYTYQEYLEGLDLSGITKSRKINIFLEIFSNTQGYTDVITKNNIPNYYSSRHSIRNAIQDEEIILKIDDIVTNRPPLSNYFRNHKVSIDMSWWKHLDRVVPFEPLIIKMQLRIPARGETLRLIDRDSLILFNDNEEIKAFRFPSDKNKKRKDPFIVPNIWQSELSFLINLVEYNKQFFPFLKRYYPDDSSLKDGIIPLFPNSDGTGPYSETQHLLYWTKVLIQAQMEFNLEGVKKNLVHSDEVEIPKNQEELDMLSSAQISKFKREYDIHSLRHTGISRYIRSGMPLKLVQLLSGHTGINTMLTVYYHVSQQELLNNWCLNRNIDIPNRINMDEICSLFIEKEFKQYNLKSKSPESVLKILNDYYFFNPENRKSLDDNIIKLSDISKTDPNFWRPQRAGICTKYECPIEKIGKCSLCSYFITNYMFIQEIGLETQLSFFRVKKYSEMIISNRNSNQHQNNMKLRQQMKLEIEIFSGWLEIMYLSKNSYDTFINNSKNKNQSKSNIISKDNRNTKLPFFIMQSIDSNHGYLEILSEAYKRKTYDNESIKDIIDRISTKILKYATKQNLYNEKMEDMTNEELVEWFLPIYNYVSSDWQINEEARRNVEEFLLKFEHQKKLENKNENTFLIE